MIDITIASKNINVTSINKIQYMKRKNKNLMIFILLLPVRLNLIFLYNLIGNK
jgi:hypothetical protein